MDSWEFWFIGRVMNQWTIAGSAPSTTVWASGWWRCFLLGPHKRTTRGSDPWGKNWFCVKIGHPQVCSLTDCINLVFGYDRGTISQCQTQPGEGFANELNLKCWTRRKRQWGRWPWLPTCAEKYLLSRKPYHSLKRCPFFGSSKNGKQRKPKTSLNKNKLQPGLRPISSVTTVLCQGCRVNSILTSTERATEHWTQKTQWVSP